eukprot:g25979.t1
MVQGWAYRHITPPLKQQDAWICIPSKAGLRGGEGVALVLDAWFQGGGDVPDDKTAGHPLPRHLVGRVGSGGSGHDLLQLLVVEGDPRSEGEGSPFVLTGLHACGDLGPTALRQFAGCPRVLGVTAVSCCYMKATTGGAAENGYPMSAWVRGLPEHGLPYKLRELACHAIEDYAGRLRRQSTGLRVHCYRATLETIIRQINPSLKRAGVQTPRNAHLLSFE